MVVGYVLAFKIYSKIEYHLSVQKKADLARAKGHVIEIPNRVREDREQEICHAYLELDSHMYLQIDIFGNGEVYTPAYNFLEDEKFQNSFTLEHTKMF